MQTSYSQNMTPGRSGLIYDTGFNDFISRLASMEIPFGRFVVKNGSDAGKVDLPVSAAEIADSLDVNRGFAAATQALEQVIGATYSSYKSNDAVSVMKRGRIWVLAEGSWSANSQVFIRHTVNGSLTQLGAARADYDGTAQVNTVAVVSTPTANVGYSVNVNGQTVAVTADGTPSQTELKDAFVAAINAVPSLAASVSASSASASTFTVTSVTAGKPFTLDGLSSPFLTNTATQANVATAEPLVGAKFVEAGAASAGNFAIIEFDLV